MFLRASCLTLMFTLASWAAPAQNIASVILNPVDPCNKRPSGRVNISAPAPANGLQVDLLSSAPAGVSVPANLRIGAGAAFAEFQLACTPGTQSIAAIITASVAGGNSATAALTVLAPVLNTFTMQPHNGAGSATGQVTLVLPAPLGGVVVTLASTSSRVTVPAFVTVPAGATAAPVTVSVSAQEQPFVVSLAATGLGVSRSVDFTVIPPVPTSVGFNDKGQETVFPTSRTVRSGSRPSMRVTLNAPSTAAINVTLSSSNSTLVVVPATLSIPNNALYADVPVTVAGALQSTLVTVTATLGSVSVTGTLTVAPSSLDRLSLTPRRIIGGQDVQGQLSMLGPSPAGGLTVTLASSNPARVLVPPTVVIPAGAHNVTFPIATFQLETSSQIDITATAGSARLTERLELAPEGPTAVKAAPTEATGGRMVQGKVEALLSDDSFVVELVSSHPAIAPVPASVTFAAGETAKTFNVPTVPVPEDVYVTWTATLAPVARRGVALNLITPGRIAPTVTVRQSGGIRVLAAVVTNLVLASSSVVGGTNTSGTVTLSGPAPKGGVLVSISTGDFQAPANAASVTVPVGASTATFTINTNAVTANKSVLFIARTGSVTKSAALEVRKP